MKMMFEIVDAIGDKFITAIDKKIAISNNLEMREMLARYSTDVISSVAFGLDSNCKLIVMKLSPSLVKLIEF